MKLLGKCFILLFMVSCTPKKDIKVTLKTGEILICKNYDITKSNCGYQFTYCNNTNKIYACQTDIKMEKNEN